MVLAAQYCMKPVIISIRNFTKMATVTSIEMLRIFVCPRLIKYSPVDGNNDTAYSLGDLAIYQRFGLL